MNLLTVLEIANNYPEYILIDAAQDKETGKFASFMYRLKEWSNPLDEKAKTRKDIHKLMLSTNPVFEAKEKAISAMKEIAESAIKYIKENK